ncbi:CBL-interacting protein kinase 2 [Nymphaea thermarum]|nr:CBL-interacting protein kinase 2 [Nymphaea thermarum]
MVTGKSVAIRVVGKEKILKVGMMEQIKREISVMKMVKHPNIVELHEVMATKTKIYFAMEYVKGGELFSKQLISAIDFCHSRGAYHATNLKVTDFGLSALATCYCTVHTTCGMPTYVAAEVLAKRGYDGAKADLWSCGLILYLLLAGFLPFQHDNNMAMYRKIYKGYFKCPPWISSDAGRLILKLLDPNHNSRITTAKLMENT